MAIAPEAVPEEFVSETVIFDYKTPAKEAFEKIKRFGTVIVTKDGGFYGIVDNRTIARQGSLKLSDKHPLGKFATRVPVLDKDVSVDKAIAQFYEFATKALPYRSGKKVTGIIKREEMLKAILSLHRLSSRKVEDAMSSPVIAIDADAQISQAKAAMQSNKVNRLVVLSNGRPIGILAYANIIEQGAKMQRRVGKQNRNLTTVTYRVMDVCEKNIKKIDPKAPLDDAIREFLKQGVSSLLVSNGEQLVGVVTIKDIFRAASSGISTNEEEIVLSGLDEETSEYEQEIRDSLHSLIDRINKFHMLQVAKITLTIRHSKVRNYEAKGRLMLVDGGSISASSSGFSLDRTMSVLTDTLYEEAKEKKERLGRKGMGAGEHE